MKTKTIHKKTISHLQQIEFFREGMALLPEPSDKRPGVAFFVPGDDFHLAQRFCTCTLSENRTCPHLKELLKTFKMVHQAADHSFEDRFRSSVWYHLATVLGEAHQASPQTLTYRSQNSGDHHVVNVKGSGGETLVHYYSTGTDRVRFLERCASSDSRDAVPHRGWALTRLSDITRTDNEKTMNAQGFKTRRQVLETSFWYRCAYHCFREFEEAREDGNGCTFKPAISEKTGAFTVICLSRNGDPLIRLFIPRDKVRKLLASFQEFSPGEHALGIHPIPLKSIFRITQNTELDLEIRPQIRLIQENGEERFFENEDLKKFTYDSLVYIKEMGIMAQLETPGRPRKFKAPVKMVLKKSQVPVFLEEYEEDLADGPFLVDASVTGFRILKEFDRIQIRPEALDRDWYWLSVAYGFGNEEISLAEILKTRKAGQRFIKSDEGWIDCASETFGNLEDLARDIRMEGSSVEEEHMAISPMALFRLQAQSPQSLDITGQEEPVHRLKQTLALKPAKPFSSPAGLHSTLRHYQALGTEWIHFLYQNRFGGLLCDDMGLGKTHEVMAFMVGLLEQSLDPEPFLVVCPTTVLSHWKNVVRRYAPSLDPVTYHGKERDLDEALAGHPLILTSYGILRRDIEASGIIQIFRCGIR
jgi:hypothetical protein